MGLEMGYLADRPELVPLLADWFFKEWGGRGPSSTLDGFTERLSGRLNRDQPPITFVAFLGDEPVGTAALKIREMETHPQYEYWLGSVYVREEHHGQGFASELIKAVVTKASQLGIANLYLYTRGKVGLYSKFGWKTVETPTYREKVVSIMERKVEAQISI